MVVDMFGLPADTIKDEFRTKVPVDAVQSVDAPGENCHDVHTGGSCKWFESKL